MTRRVCHLPGLETVISVEDKETVLYSDFGAHRVLDLGH